MSDGIAAFLERPPTGVYIEAYRVLRNYEDARDAVAEAVRLAWQHADEYRGDASITAWFAAIVRNVALMEGRRRMRRLRGRDEVLRRAPVVRTPESRAIALERRERVSRGVRCLPPPYRAAVECVYYDGLTIDQAARRLGISHAACKSRIHRVWRILRERIR